ncbi:MAG: ankyrin repeat domain-containing protein [Rhodospirillales bacterium]|nr:ankyrin repeat domain-containing protein [Rhodospirillales bacterium]
MHNETDEYNKKEQNDTGDGERKNKVSSPKKHSAWKAFALSGLVLLSTGFTTLVKQVKREKAKNEWYDINKGADSISVNTKEGTFFAMKKKDVEAIKKLEQEKEQYIQQKNQIISNANKEFSLALQKFDTDGMRHAVESGANNINTPNKQGQTPLIQLARNISSAKAYYAARYLISIDVDVNAKDKDGATAEDYLTVSGSLKSATLIREINEKKKTPVNHGGQSQELYYIDNQLEEISQKIYNLGGYTANIDKDGWSYNSPHYSESGNDCSAVSTYANKQDKQKAKKDIQKANDIWHFYDKQR